MKTPKRTYYFDSGVFVAYFSDEVGRADIVEELLENAKAGDIEIVVSSIVLVEVIKKRHLKALTRVYEQQIVDPFEYPFFSFVEATRGICESARDLIWKHQTLKPYDATHLASALFFSTYRHLDGLFSFDTDFTDLNNVVTKKFPITLPYVEQPSLALTDAPVEKKEDGAGGS